MSKNNCELIRRELDELMLNEAYSASVAEHLRDCAECREFQDKQKKLRQMVGSLGTVAAPPDFDFRLRARLANEASGAGSTFHYWPVVRRALAVATVLLILASAGILVRNVMNGRAGGDVASKEGPIVLPPSPEPVPIKTPVLPDNLDHKVIATIRENQPQVVKAERSSQPSYKVRRPMAAIDFSNERAEVITGTELIGASAAFPIDASLQSFKVSLDDGRGNARTISVPTISFGSQRIVQGANQFAPKRVW
ncbi:MAG TPA: hypothetical protein VF088_21830 [Pyrinomonadaceae bacterium]